MKSFFQQWYGTTWYGTTGCIYTQGGQKMPIVYDKNA